MSIQSAWALPPGVIHSPEGHEPIDLSIEAGRLNWATDCNLETTFFWVDNESHSFYWPEIGGFRVFKDGRVIVDAKSTAPQGLVEHILLGPVLADVFSRRARLPLHASCVRAGQETIAIVGPSGAGKSTLAAALVKNGALTHGDDLLNVCPKTGEVPFGTARSKLNTDSAASLGHNENTLDAVFEGNAKKALVLQHSSETSDATPQVSVPPPARLTAIYRLVDHNEAEPQFERLPSMQAALGLVMDTFMVEVHSRLLGGQQLLDRCSSLAGVVPLFLLKRRKDLNQLDRLAQAVLQHAALLKDPTHAHCD